MDELFSDASPSDRRQAVVETLACFHVVFHPTPWHHIENNLALSCRFREEIELACERFGVPPAMAFAIFTWENSGSTAARSFAACVGMGQLSVGAMQHAHRVSVRFARLSLVARGSYQLVADIASAFVGEGNSIVRGLRGRAALLARRAKEFDLASEHARLVRMSGVADERVIPRANIEDSVVYMRSLLEMYGGHADLAISAYHDGVRNTDDLFRDYLRRKDRAAAAFTLRNRAPLFAAIQRYRISYITLWSDGRCRQMLNGLRTMDGDITSAANQREAMGDESDIYPWKTLAALAGLRASPQQVQLLLERYRHDQSESETWGFTPGRDLVRTRGRLPATRELAGYLGSLERRVRRRVGKAKPAPTLVVSALHDTLAHRSGLACDVTVNSQALDALLREDWLYDRIYKKRLTGGALHICLNPRFGKEFLQAYDESQRSASAAR